METNRESKGYFQGFVTESAVAYVPGGIGQRSLRSNLREGKPLTWRKEAAVSDGKTERQA